MGGFVSNLFADRRQIVLAVGILDVCQEFGPFVGQRHPAPEEVAGGPHGGRIDRGLREHAAAQKRRNLVGIDRVIFRLTAMDRLHGEGMTEDKRNSLAGTQVGQPVPGEDAFDTDDQIRPVGRDGLEKWLWAGWHIPVHQDLPLPVASQFASELLDVFEQKIQTETLPANAGHCPLRWNCDTFRLIFPPTFARISPLHRRLR